MRIALALLSLFAMGLPTFVAAQAPINVNAEMLIAARKGDQAAVRALLDQGANANLLANSVNWATIEESLINLTPKTPTTRTLVLTNALTGNFIFLLTVVLMPLAILILGGVVWFQRRRHV